MSLFVDERGYTSIATVVALLVSISLVFCLASAEWTLTRAADIQEVADAAALSGSNVVAAFCTIAQVLDAGVLSMGLTGMAVLGAGLVLAAVPGAQGASTAAIDAGHEILNARNDFAQSVCEGLEKLELSLPALSVVNSASCISANSEEDVAYSGIAVLYPLESRSNYSSIDSEVEDTGIGDAAERLQEKTREAEEAKRRADDALERGWHADCVDDPSCLRSRAASLAQMTGPDNPPYGSAESWSFGVAIQRARTYYARRIALEAPKGSDIESVVDSVARRAWYEYALQEVNGARYLQRPNGSVDLDVPHLARNANEVKGTRLYTDAVWPCTIEGETRTLHATLSCPGATGEGDGRASVADIDSGAVHRCETCAFDVSDLGAVASISTSATNGFEHYWQAIVEAASSYERARNEQAAAEEAMRESAEEGKGIFEDALEQLKVPRPKLCPPGAWGCVSVVHRDSGTAVPPELTRVLALGADLPAGIAISASALAPDDDTNGNTVLSRFFDGISHDANNPMGGVLGGFMGLWGSLLNAYGNAFEGVGSSVGGFLDGLGGGALGAVGGWLRNAVSGAMDALGLEPADMRLRKPVLVSPSKVFAKAGIDEDGSMRTLIQSIPFGRTPEEMASVLGTRALEGLGGGNFTIAEIPIPGTGLSIPIGIDLDRREDDS